MLVVASLISALLWLAINANAFIIPKFDHGQVQPGCYNPPEIPHSLSSEPQRWRDPQFISSTKPRYSGRVWQGWQNVQYIFAFGDSYTSTSFDINGQQPDSSNPLGNPAYPGFTSSNGPNYVDFLTTTYNQSFIETYNLGYGGATVDPSVVGSPYGLVVQSFRQQVQDEFLPRYGDQSSVQWSGSDSLFTIFFGINDAILTYSERNSTLNFDIIKSYENLVYQLYAIRARNFVFLNVPPIDRSPRSLPLDAGTRASMAGYIGELNFRLVLLVRDLQTRYLDTTAWLFDTNWLVTRLLNNGPAAFTETTSYRNLTNFCSAYEHGTPLLTTYDPVCGVPVNEYLWLNDLHVTYPMHNLIAAKIVQQITG